MASFSIQGINIAGIAATVPKTVEHNMDYTYISEKERKSLIKVTGVEQRRVASAQTTTSDLCFEAATKLIDELNWKKEDISILIFVSQSSDYFLPATAVILQGRLGLPTHCMAFDIALGCSGYVYGLSVITGLMHSAGIKKGLLLVGDVSSVICSKTDKSTYPLFGDAGTATAVELTDDAKPIHFNLNNDGNKYNTIIVQHGRGRNRGSPDSFRMEKIAEGIERSKLNIELNGIEVFNFSINEVPEMVNELFRDTQTTSNDYDYLVLHQANRLINETIRKKLGFDAAKVPYSISKYGNTSSASIPLTIASELREQISKNKLRLLCAGFGVGLSWGAVSFTTNKTVILPVLEI
ncbi:MAG: ketoacyl-ACP synthase III [Bacteroidia bacterium]|nr:ketoacyl-ACP synthase III [Bacteroidia bacterium]